jgi:hypothetical protein
MNKKGGSEWESNPPRTATRPNTGVEDQGAHRDSITPGARITYRNRFDKRTRKRGTSRDKKADSWEIPVDSSVINRGISRASSVIVIQNEINGTMPITIPPMAKSRSRFAPPLRRILHSAIPPRIDPRIPRKLLGIKGSGSVHSAKREITKLAMASQLREEVVISAILIFYTG